MLARAKVNLYLHVTGRRADGYHLLDSLIVFAETGDEIALAPADRLSLTIDGPFGADLEAGPENLVLRAAHALQDVTGTRAGAAIRLTKNLPVASGIGGGSADAATTLDGLCGLWNVAPGRAALLQIAAKLGADVPVCLDGVPSFVGGIGEELAPARGLPPAWLLLANPGAATPTPAVFKARRGPFSKPARCSEPPRDFAEFVGRLQGCRNDLTEAAISVTPAIRDVLVALAALPGCVLARLSGSGATCFGLFGNEAGARAAEAKLRVDHPAWWATAAPMATSSR
ncbi:4-(cytidine 5'-diphospho)-2-C-methyl-D-erythritol kinase [Dongia deserti]|uniref:4-(cytidine 5'-diphospho)-2-C-methyl-D-erythritol kinase n=1 Tax=Dongia deserti TaxID=2268030 RepID=UPI000E65BFAB|nr:4-(cytidine 5'-diphospho)-2-C-methyl-D-erythritol kinase [Dongia deserti]